MNSATPLCPCKKGKDNYARLCYVLIEVGTLVLTEIFNKVCSPKKLELLLKDDKIYSKLSSLRKRRVLSASQWSKLYPVFNSSVSSRYFDSSLQLLLLRTILGLNLSVTGQENFPPETDTSPVAGITCLKVLRDRIHHHDTSGSVNDETFSSHCSDIKKIIMRFGGCWYLTTINGLEVDPLCEDLAEDYQKRLREWLRDDAFTKDKLEEGTTMKKARKEEDMEGLIDISKQISGMEESKLNNHAHNGAPESSKISPPELSFDIPEISQLSFLSTNWENVELPVDILLFTVRKDEFLSCFGFLKNPIMRSSRGCIGIVYFSSMEDERGNKIKIALMRCSKGRYGPGGALSAAKDAIFLLRPKVLFSVGACNGVNRSKVKLGDVVVSSKLKTLEYLISPMRNINNLISNIGDGWKAPLQNANGYKPEIHSGLFLCVSEANNDIISGCTEAIAVEKEGGGVWTAAHDYKTEWLIVKGIKGFANDNQSYNKDWKKFACVMAASVVANLLTDPVIFQDWPHFDAATSPCSAASTASASKPVCA